jgi:hypothetical protein
MQQCANFSGKEEEREPDDEEWWKARFIHEMHTANSDVALVEQEREREREREGHEEAPAVFWIETTKVPRSKLGWMRFLGILQNNK